MEFHTLSNTFPLMDDEALADLAESIKEHGQRESITTYEGQILDGRNRYRACQLIAVPPAFHPFDGDDPLAYVVDMNLKRRHLNESQRAMVASKLATRTQRDTDRHLKKEAQSNQSDSDDVEISTSQPTVNRTAKLFNISRDSVIAAKLVRTKGSADDIKAVEEGKAAVSTVANKIRAREKGENFVPKSRKKKNGRSLSEARIHTKLAKDARSAILALAAMPAAADVLTAIKQRGDRGVYLEDNLQPAIDWLERLKDERSNS